MNDRYLFKAKRVDNGEWCTGNLVISEDVDDELKAIIIPKRESGMYTEECCVECLGFENWYKVDLATICQCTGMKDFKGNLIFENDIIKCGRPTFVSWNEKFASWCLTRKGWLYSHFFGESHEPEDCEVIGNIFDNSELLEEKQ